ncbi:MAG: efflux RND transporter permease subunit [Bacteroidales bacterium]|jgi:HAE1 family hydrophobic/amphiphilic exporter-1|nr:efflux RND transporter permease subunit [Bacteroidales bacterium]
MSLYESSVKKPITTILIFLTVVVLGIFSWSKLSVDLFPEFDMNQAVVLCTYSGASAEDVENNVTKLLESTLSTISDLKKISSTSKDNVAIIQIELNWGTDLDNAVNDMRDRLEMIKQSLPDGCSNPMIIKISTDMMPVTIYSATAKESSSALYKILDDGLANPLARVSGVGSVSISGVPKREIIVNVDPKQMEAYNLTVEQIGSAIAQDNINTPSGSMDIGSETYSLRIEGELKESELLNNVVVANYGGKTIFLKDVARVSDTVQEKAQENYVNGAKGATVVIQKQSGANSVDVMNRINKALPDIMKDLPRDIKLQEVMNTTDNIKNSINSLMETIILACLFVIIVVLFFLGKWRATIIILMTIPVSLIASFIYLYASGNSLNIISLSAISIAIGMVVDDAIVVLENITTHIERGSKPREAAIYGTNEVAVAVIAATLTLLAVFFPFTMMSGLAGLMFKQLGWMICIVMIISLACALSLTPMLCSQLMRKDTKQSGFFNKLYRPIKKGFDKLDVQYERLLRWVLGHKLITTIIIIAAFIGSMMLSKSIGSEFIPMSDNGQITGNIQLPIGANVDRSREIALRFENDVRKEFPNEVKTITTTIGQPSDDDDNSWAMLQTSGNNYISIRVKLTDYRERKKDMFEITERLRQIAASYTEVAKYNIIAGGQNGGFGGGSTVDAEIYGFDFKVTEDLAQKIKGIMGNIKGFTNIVVSREDYQPQYQIEFDREKLALNGLTLGTASSFVRNRMNGLTCSLFREDGDEYKIKVRYDRSSRHSVEDIENILIYNSAGKAVRVSEVANVVERFAPPSIQRQDRERIVKVSANLYGVSLDVATKELQAQLDKLEKPSNINIDIAGTIVDQQDTFSDMIMLSLLIIMLVYIVMAAQFESLLYPFIIMFSIPFALIGVFLSLFLTGITINMMSAIGMVMLIGIVVKNGIVLVDYINLNRERGIGIKAAVIMGGKSRLRPVLMTTLTTILGMLPMAFKIGEGSALWQPMGVVIVGGLTISTMITLLFMPVIYTAFASISVRKYHKEGKGKLTRRNTNLE